MNLLQTNNCACLKLICCITYMFGKIDLCLDIIQFLEVINKTYIGYYISILYRVINFRIP